MNSSELLKTFNKFLNDAYCRENAGDKIFDNLKTILHFKSACLFYISGEYLKPVYTFNFEKQNVEEENIKGLKKYTLRQTLFVNVCPYAKLIITDEKPYTNEEKEIFKTCAGIISNIIKEIELTDIMKIQVKALQDGISEINGFNKLIKKQNKKILEADRVKNKFLSNVSHELRSPLNSIIGFSNMLLTEAFGKLNSKQNEYIQDIQTAGIHLLGMVNEVLDISKIESHAMKLSLCEFDVQICLTEVLNILKPLYIKKEITIENEIADGTYITADYQKLQQIFFNLLSNAIKFTQNTGTIKIYSKIGLKYIVISIKDNGIGINKKYQKKIFKKFEQINPIQSNNSNSTGLGLTITKELVKLHHGAITVESEEGKGSVFHIKLPEKNTILS